MIDLYCGLGGWASGGIAEGWEVYGFDIERHDYGTGGYPAQLVLQNVLTIHGRQFKDAALIVASPPCQEYSYMAMPWSRAKAIAAEYRAGVRDVKQLTALFDTCFRIQREACEAAGHHIPMIVENVRGAQPWVGRARWAYGSYYLWGDVPALMPMTGRAQKFNPDGTAHGTGSWFAIADSKNRGAQGQKTVGHINKRDGHGYTRHLTNQAESDHVKGYTPNGGPLGKNELARMHGSKSKARKARKAASAAIAKIPLALATFIAHTFHPRNGVFNDESNGDKIGRSVRALDGDA